jgi:Shikimate 5-dehydrogenase
MKKFGLIGFPLGHSFSKKYYDAKISRERIQGVEYGLYPLSDIREFPELIRDDHLTGLNVTIPYKIAVMDYVDRVSPEAAAVGAVNCICISRPPGRRPVLTGYNTDVYGFTESLKPLLRPTHRKALVLGAGGAAKAVIYALSDMGIAHTTVSRSPQPGQFGYHELNAAVLADHPLVINTTPLGTYPAVEESPDIPYQHLGPDHLLYDLVYNPAETAFLKQGRAQGASVKNGLEMLELQAERNWEIWNGN